MSSISTNFVFVSVNSPLLITFVNQCLSKSPIWLCIWFRYHNIHFFTSLTLLLQDKIMKTPEVCRKTFENENRKKVEIRHPRHTPSLLYPNPTIFTFCTFLYSLFDNSRQSMRRLSVRNISHKFLWIRGLSFGIT